MRVGFITEGATDQIVLKAIIETIFDDPRIAFNSLQPELDGSDKQKSFGGWNLVFDYFKSVDFELLLELNDFVVVHVDSDRSFEKGFDVPHSESGGKANPEDLCERVTQKLHSLIPLDQSDENRARFLYAVGVHSIECWLIGLVDSNHNSKVVNACFDKLNTALRKKNLRTISENAKNKGTSQRVYLDLVRQFQRKKTLRQQSKRNVGFANFVSQLQRVQAQIASTDQS